MRRAGEHPKQGVGDVLGAEPGRHLFAKTLLHLGVSPEKLLESVARLAMWVGGLPAADASFAIQKAIREYQQEGLGSLAVWFPEKRTR